jgi:hypothetical protein
MNDAVAIAAGELHSMALKANGTVWGWGENLKGQIGASLYQTHFSLPVPAALPPQAVAIGVGWKHSLAVESDGSLWSWGYNSLGQLGHSGSIVTTLPFPVTGLNGAVAVAGGMDHSLVRGPNGGLWAFGDNWFGQLGDGTTIGRPTPVQLPGPSLQPAGLFLAISQPGGAGRPVFLQNTNLNPGSEYYNVFSVDVCSGPQGTGPYGGLCITSGLNMQILMIQLSMPLGTPPFHFVPLNSGATFGPLFLPQLTLDALCFEFTNGVVGATSLVARISVQ